MAYKSLLTVVTDAEAPAPSLEQAISLTRVLDAHLEVVCLGIDPVQTGFYEVGAGAAMLQASLEQAHAHAKEIQAAVEERLERSGLRSNTTVGVATSPDVGHPVARAARFADLAIASLPYGEGGSSQDVGIVEELLFEASCPTLCLPRDTEARLPKEIVVGWNYSAQALRATRVAMPFLKAADHVHIAVIDPPAHGPEGSDPGGQLAVLLSRHGVSCEVSVLTKGSDGVGGSLNQFARESGADMVVMGAYGHSRFREALLGGVTRHMLQGARCPVLMAH